VPSPGEVDVRFGLLKGKQATWPVTELADRWLPNATADEIGEALKLVSEEAARLLVDQSGFSVEDAFIFLCVACAAGVALQAGPAVRDDRALLDPPDQGLSRAVHIVTITSWPRCARCNLCTVPTAAQSRRAQT
jgi:hypothetical protein